MTKFKHWLYNKFLPSWCKEDLLSANQRLDHAIGEQKAEIARLNAYIDGLENAIRHQRRIVIRNEVSK